MAFQIGVQSRNAKDGVPDRFSWVEKTAARLLHAEGLLKYNVRFDSDVSIFRLH